jgi:EAL domain-containing protein (putative c-di-GMP-specific phosphodiesterase class I)
MLLSITQYFLYYLLILTVSKNINNTYGHQVGDEIVLHYQPILDIKSKKNIGVEALIRWQHPNLGFVPATDFILVSEATGTILPIGTWVMIW